MTSNHGASELDNVNNQRSGLAMSNLSQVELKNILDQLDKKIDQKRLRWETQKKELETKLEISARALEDKNNEIENLKKTVQKIQDDFSKTIKKYESKMSELIEELSKVKNNSIQFKRSRSGSASSKKSNERAPPPPLTLKKALNAPPPSANSTFMTSSESSSSSASNQSNTGSAVSSTLNSAAARRTQLPRFAPETVVEATTTTKPPVYVDKNNNYNVAASNDEKQERRSGERPKQALQTKSSQEETQSDKISTYKHELDEHFKKMEALKSAKATTTTTTKPPVNVEKKQERKSRDRSKQPHERNSVEAQLNDYKDQLKKRDEYIRNLEKLESENNIQLQFYKDEVKKYTKQESELKAEIDKLKSYNDVAMERLDVLDKDYEREKKDTRPRERKAFA